ncbi:MAG: hypothetical protein CVU57_01390 [Deltaproteobacteria bacterium HGW-Deltaproteobacteria-15]|jgi:TRAP-type C4-dicarboxylate transport system permease small subunit|nr:MAG: hypothetical protein CVU57_01390 [Deltaproteobacteria bacterium HGW-Deltaproteobacteria-15]
MNTSGQNTPQPVPDSSVKPLQILGGVFDRVLDGLAFLSGVLLIALMILVCAAVILRYFMNRPLGWSVEVSQYMLVAMGYLVVAWVLRREKHVKVDVLVDLLSESRRALIHFITSTLNTAVCLIIAAAAFKSTWDLYKAGYFEPTILMIPKFIFIGIIAFGCTILSIQFWRRTHGFYKKWRMRAPKAA